MIYTTNNPPAPLPGIISPSFYLFSFNSVKMRVNNKYVSQCLFPKFAYNEILLFKYLEINIVTCKFIIN